MKIPIIFEDENFLALNKPANLLVEPTKNSQKKTLIDFLKEKLPQNKNFDSQRLGLVHRLDKETSGVLLVAKNKIFFDYLKKLFKERKIKKEYLALVYGWPNKKRGEINLPIGWGGKLKTTDKKARKRKPALTFFELIKKIKGQEKYSLLKVFPKTGRTNQIRIHLAKIGLPIVGDKVYGRKKSLPEETKKLKRQFLHCSALEFLLPNKKTKIRIESDLAKDLKEFLKMINPET